MKKYLVFSDSHGNGTNINRVFEAFKGKIAGVIFLGDGEREFDALWNAAYDIETYRVRGNCDYDSYAEKAVITLSGHKVFITHGHRNGVNYDFTSVALEAKKNDCEAALFGHTHCRFLGVENNVKLMNPGSVSLPRDGYPPSVGIITIDDDDKLIFETFSVDCIIL